MYAFGTREAGDTELQRQDSSATERASSWHHTRAPARARRGRSTRRITRAAQVGAARRGRHNRTTRPPPPSPSRAEEPASAFFCVSPPARARQAMWLNRGVRTAGSSWRTRAPSDAPQLSTLVPAALGPRRPVLSANTIASASVSVPPPLRGSPPVAGWFHPQTSADVSEAAASLCRCSGRASRVASRPGACAAPPRARVAGAGISTAWRSLRPGSRSRSRPNAHVRRTPPAPRPPDGRVATPISAALVPSRRVAGVVRGARPWGRACCGRGSRGVARPPGAGAQGRRRNLTPATVPGLADVFVLSGNCSGDC
jgi:hypothetical protein